MHSTGPKAWSLALLSTLAVPTSAYWRMQCPGTVFEGRLDPIVAPGAVSSHAHVVLGGNAFAPSMDYETTQYSTCTSCTILGDNSNYWVPKLYYQYQNGSFVDVPVQGGTVYYEQRMSSPIPGQTIQAFPKGFRMTAGNPDLRTYSNTLAQNAITHACLGITEAEQSYLPTTNCPDGVRSQVYFPSCWDGVNLDSEGHQCHMSYPTGDHFDSGECPMSHPIPLISIFYEFIWGTNNFADQWYGDSQPFVFSMGDNTGYGFHGDFINGWDIELLEYAIQNFITNVSGDADNMYYNNYFNPPQGVTGTGCQLPPMVDEQINGVLDALPGCNPVTDNPVPNTSCGAPTTTGQVTSSIFTDMTAEGWEYLGCGVDVYGDPALGDPVEDSPTMTVQNCITLCGSKGYSVSGLEYASQCMCGNTIPARASPTPGAINGCNMPCAGNSSELCGAGNRLSLYQKCTGTCRNAQFGLAGEGVVVPAVTPVPAPSICGAASDPVTTVITVASAVQPPLSVLLSPLGALGTPVAAPAPPAAALSSPVSAPQGSAAAANVETTPTASAEGSGSQAENTGAGVVYSNVASTATANPPAASSAWPSSTPSSSQPVSTGSVSSSNGNSSVALPSGWTSAGCYSDALNPRSLSGITFAWWGQEITSSGCAQYCDSEGYSYAGTENAGQCFCGNELVQSEPQPSTDCDMPCEGSDSEICGGAARLSVFKSSTATRRRRSAHLRRHGVQAAS